MVRRAHHKSFDELRTSRFDKPLDELGARLTTGSFGKLTAGIRDITLSLTLSWGYYPFSARERQDPDRPR